MPLVEPIDELKSQVTSGKPRDEKGKFIKIPNVVPSKNVVENFLLSHTGHYKDQDDLLDIKIGNPLGRILKLLEEIKKQKAFSFTIKGSLGIAGVVLVLSAFGIFGGSKIICEKGIQSHVGMVRVLGYREIYSKPVNALSYLFEMVSPPQKLIKNRTVLIKNDLSTIYLPFSEEVNFANFANTIVIITGNYNSCSHMLSVNDSSSIEAYAK